jgi:hypothetical protein
MRRLLISGCVIVGLLALVGVASAQQISGSYIETRNADIWTGACVANSEINLAGDQAILAWHVDHGNWNGIALDGLGVVGVVKAAATLGDTYNNPYPAQAVMIVDDKANAEQRTALVAFAQEMSGELLKNVLEVKVERIKMEMGNRHDMHDVGTSLEAGKLVGVATRAIGKGDHLCGNENVYYQPLAKLTHSMPAVAELDRYDGPGLGVVWTLHDKRSAFVGSFAR